MENLFGQQEPAKILPLKNRSGSFNINPCIAVFGDGPDGSRCKNCTQLRYKAGSKKFFKCALRTITNGAATDHKVNWPGCAKFEQIANDGGIAHNAAHMKSIKEQLLAGKRITVQSVLKSIGTQELRTYIPRFRREFGMIIDTNWLYRDGKKFKEYFIKESNQFKINT
jgi:hypothetical protein